MLMRCNGKNQVTKQCRAETNERNRKTEREREIDQENFEENMASKANENVVEPLRQQSGHVVDKTHPLNRRRNQAAGRKKLLIKHFDVQDTRTGTLKGQAGKECQQRVFLALKAMRKVEIMRLNQLTHTLTEADLLLGYNIRSL